MRAPQPFKRILGADAALAEWLARHESEEALTNIIRKLLPRPLAARVRVADCKRDPLELTADAGAIAAIVRQRSGELLAALKRGGWQFTGIRVRVQVSTGPVAVPKRQFNPVDRASLQPLGRLARELPPGPLRDAVERLLRRAG
jgi:Dna[CI] antecedent DciA-like protein